MHSGAVDVTAQGESWCQPSWQLTVYRVEYMAVHGDPETWRDLLAQVTKATPAVRKHFEEFHQVWRIVYGTWRPREL